MSPSCLNVFLGGSHEEASKPIVLSVQAADESMFIDPGYEPDSTSGLYEASGVAVTGVKRCEEAIVAMPGQDLSRQPSIPINRVRHQMACRFCTTVRQSDVRPGRHRGWPMPASYPLLPAE